MPLSSLSPYLAVAVDTHFNLTPQISSRVTELKSTFAMLDKYDEIGDTVLRPQYFAHVVFRTANYLPMREFYKTFLGGHATYENEKLCFITYDEEHHRVAVINLADTGPKIASSAGLGMRATMLSFRPSPA